MIHAREPQTAAAVARHYDELDRFYREVWGDHVHHGYWVSGRESPEEAVEALVRYLADRLELRAGERACDVGCGYGAAAKYLASTRQLGVTGLTISPVQATRAQPLAESDPRLKFFCRDWLSNALEDQAFDAVYAIESTEHMEDKAGFFREAHRVLRPGGRLGVFAWLAREGATAWEIRHLLEPICREGRLPSMGTQEDYRDLAAAAGFTVTGFDDLSRNVRSTWTVCARRLVGKLLSDSDYRRFLLNPREANRVFALTIMRIIIAYRLGSMQYQLLTASK